MSSTDRTPQGFELWIGTLGADAPAAARPQAEHVVTAPVVAWESATGLPVIAGPLASVRAVRDAVQRDAVHYGTSRADAVSRVVEAWIGAAEAARTASASD